MTSGAIKHKLQKIQTPQYQFVKSQENSQQSDLSNLQSYYTQESTKNGSIICQGRVELKGRKSLKEKAIEHQNVQDSKLYSSDITSEILNINMRKEN